MHHSAQRRNDADEIIPRIWLGNYRASTDEDFIRKNNINVVFNCTKDLPFSYSIPIKFRVPVDDNLQEAEIRNLELWAAEIAHKILMEYNKGHTILIHCMAGMQRSAACVAFFLIVHEEMHALDEMAFIKQRRSIAFHPSANFGRSIDYFDRQFYTEILPRM